MQEGAARILQAVLISSCRKGGGRGVWGEATVIRPEGKPLAAVPMSYLKYAPALQV